jgi:hypothetical protein
MHIGFHPRCHPRARTSCFAKQNLEVLDPRIHNKVTRDDLLMNGSPGQEKSLFFFEKQAFSSPRMTAVEEHRDKKIWLF